MINFENSAPKKLWFIRKGLGKFVRAWGILLLFVILSPFSGKSEAIHKIANGAPLKMSSYEMAGSRFFAEFKVNKPLEARKATSFRWSLVSTVREVFPTPTELADRIITGKVLNEIGSPLSGVSVVVKRTTNGTTTDEDGNFSLSVGDDDQVLEFSMIGFKTQEQAIGQKSILNVTLAAESGGLDEVIVVGYGTTRKEDLSTSVSTITLDNSVKSGKSDLNTILQGRLSGVTIQSGGGDPLMGGTISIRGRGSRGLDDDPGSGDGVLYVVDGVPNAPFNVADIESVSVLKDAASAAIYGATVGSGGVIVITTKQAKSGEPRVSFNTYHGVQQIGHKPGTLTSEQYNEVWTKAIDDQPAGGTAVLPIVADPSKYAYGTRTRTNWLDEIFRSAYSQHYDVSLNGGTDRLKALGSFAYDNNQGTMLNTYMKKFNGRLNMEFGLSDKVKISENVDFQHSSGQGGINNSSHEGVIMNAIFYPRSATIYEHDASGNALFDDFGHKRFGGTIPQYLADAGISGYGEIRNPVASLLRLRQYRPSSTIYSTTKLEVQPVSGLMLITRYTAGLTDSRIEDFSPRIPEIGRPTNENSRTVSSSQNKNWQWETTGSYSTTFSGSHKLDALLGFTMFTQNYRFTSTSVFDFDKENTHSAIFPAGDNWSKNKPGEDIWDEATTSVFGRVGYSYANRYFLTASLRRDASSKLFRENNSGWFPAVSGSWKISSESFFANVKESLKIDLLKVRGSWGQIGNIKLVPRYSYDAPLAFPDWPYILGENLDNEVFGVYQRTLSNRHLKWETTEQTGIGLDFTFLNRSIDISVDYYHKITKDLIERLPPPSVAGVEIAPYENIGKVLNKGWEFTAAYNKSFGEFDLRVWGNLNTVKNVVQDIGPRGFMAHGNTMNGLQPLRSAVGEPWYSYYLIKTDGIFQSTDEIDAHVNSHGVQIQPNAVPGDLIFIDQNDDGKINDDDRIYMGSYLPKLTYAFGANLGYKNFDLSLMFQGISEVEIFSGFKQMGLTGRFQGNNMLSEVLDSWNFDKSSGLPRLSIAGDENNNYGTPSDFLLESGAYMRLKNVTFGYSFPGSKLSGLGLLKGGLRVFFAGENLFTLTSYSGFDPEVGNFGLDAGTYPVARSYSIGINLNF